MRVFNDLNFVESLGSWIARVLKVDPREVFQFYDNHLRVVINFNEKTNTSSFDYDINDRECIITKLILLNGVIKTEDIKQQFSI